MAACEQCWTEASRRALTLGRSAAKHYREVMAENPNGHPEAAVTHRAPSDAIDADQPRALRPE